MATSLVCGMLRRRSAQEPCPKRMLRNVAEQLTILLGDYDDAGGRSGQINRSIWMMLNMLLIRIMAIVRKEYTLFRVALTVDAIRRKRLKLTTLHHNCLGRLNQRGRRVRQRC